VIEVYKILKGFEGTDEVKKLRQRWMGCTRGHQSCPLSLNHVTLFKKRVNLDAVKFSFGNRVCDEWN